MADEMNHPHLVTFLPPEQAGQTAQMSNGHHYTRGIDQGCDCVSAWDHDDALMRAEGYRRLDGAEAAKHHACRVRALPGPHREALEAAQVPAEQIVALTPTAGHPIVVAAQRVVEKARRAEAETAQDAATAKGKK